ncbi:MAG: gluconate 2-dehydrogenase subunit 3 family protein [Saprospiraceae bacterium]|nr:gluconate 2-dehydrogenase subunit 3 family protein [Saprospiraceae bacterium]
MDRRALLKSIAIITGASVVGGDLLLLGCKSTTDNNGLFSPGDVTLMDEIAETILPETDIPGAKAAGVGAIMAVMVKDCYSVDQQMAFVDGLKELDAASTKALGKSYLEATADERQEFLIRVDQDAKAAMQEGSSHYFTMIKQLALFGYFTSEIGATQALRYVQVPGRYEGCIPYTRGEKAWAL